MIKKLLTIYILIFQEIIKISMYFEVAYFDRSICDFPMYFYIHSSNVYLINLLKTCNTHFIFNEDLVDLDYVTCITKFNKFVAKITAEQTCSVLHNTLTQEQVQTLEDEDGNHIGDETFAYYYLGELF